MPALQSLSFLLKIDTTLLSKEETLLLDLNLFTKIYRVLKQYYLEQQQFYFRLIKFTKEMENSVIEKKFLCLIINDILSTEEYTLSGLAYYTDTHIDVIQEILDERNVNPSALFLRRLIEIHLKVRHDLYENILKKIY